MKDDYTTNGDAGGNNQSKPSHWQIVGSVIAAAFGVQSRKNRERDFGYGRAAPFVVAGIIFTTLFVAIVYGVVSTVLRQAGQ
ncbi:MAG: DUF2970 domain-containing protein [Spongiibacteraceae bacterium]|jgi:hypothetical protein|nr:DUF2970 domain-containing protein [Spongiibacteraceae bacterium]